MQEKKDEEKVKEFKELVVNTKWSRRNIIIHEEDKWRSYLERLK